jgi:hypothetical protein
MTLGTPVQIFFNYTYGKLQTNSLEELGVDGSKYRIGFQKF